MPTIKCTKKLGDRAGLKLGPAAQRSDNDWHANIFVLDHRFYVIFCEDRSRFSVLAGPVVKADLQDLPQLLRENLARSLRSEGLSECSVECVLESLSGTITAKSDDRSVIGTINDNIWHVKIYAHEAGGVDRAGIDYLSKHLNHMPMAPLGWKYAIEAFIESRRVA
jgi:hypothetical protein